MRSSASRPGVWVPITVLVAVSMGSSGLAAAKPPVSSLHFDAIPRIGPNWPGDPSGAIGRAAIVTAVNTSIAVYDRAGVALLAPTPLQPLGTFPPGTDLFDPKVVYDPYAQEFVLVFLAIHDALERSWIVLSAIPDATASDPATWCVHQIGADQVNRDGKQWADYPGLGFARDRVTVTSNQFDFAGPQGFAYAQVLSFDKTGLYDCTKPLKFQPFGGAATSNPDGTRAFTVQPATSAGTAPADQYLMSYRRARRGGSALVLWRLRQTTGGLRLTRVAIPVAKATVSPYGTQAGGGLNTIGVAYSSSITVPCIVKSWLNCSWLRNCMPGRASSVRISMAIAPPTMKKANEVTRYMMPICLWSVVRNIRSRKDPLTAVRVG